MPHRTVESPQAQPIRVVGRRRRHRRRAV